MNAKQLIEHLQNYPEGLEVVMMGSSHYQWKIQDVKLGDHRKHDDIEVIIIEEGNQI